MLCGINLREISQSAQFTILHNEFQNHTFKVTVTTFKDQWVNSSHPKQNGRHFADDMFLRIFLNENIWIKKKIIEIHSLGSNWQCISIVSDNGFARSRWQAIIWTNAYPVHRRIYAVLGGNELMIAHFNVR